MTVEIRVLTDGIPIGYLGQLRMLEHQVLTGDGGRLKLEWGALEEGRVTTGVFAVDGNRIVGYLGRYKYGAATTELAGAVDPAFRRRGIGAMVLDTALDTCAGLGDGTALLIVPRPSTDGAALARARGGTLNHCEHSLLLTGQPTHGASDESLGLRPAHPDEIDAVAALMSEGFGFPHQPSEDELPHTYVVTDGEDLIGTIRLTHDNCTGYVHGFVIQGVRRGRGIGRDILRRAVGILYEQGVDEVRLEVDVTNESALGLYASLGFEPVLTEDYYELPTAAS
jgi:ribosomal protein S18 acetylase RimI-like enzyme